MTEIFARITSPVLKCRSCKAQIRWVKVEKSGKKMPVNAAPDPNGLILAGGDHYTSHYATCPDAKKWRTQKVKRGTS